MTFPSSIQAIVIKETGGPEVLEKTVVPFPQAKPGDLIIKTEYFGVNFIDTYFRQGLYPLGTLPAALGNEAAGIIVGLPSDPSTVNDENYKKRGYKIGDQVATDCLGCHAEYVSVPWKSAYPVPSSVSTLSAAAGLLQCITAVTFMTEAYDVQKGDIVLVHTVAGGLGLVLAQFAKYRGATVIGTTSTKEKAEIAKANGADYIVLYPVEDTVKRVLEITNGEGVHVIFDGVGKDTFENNFKMIRRKGTIVSLGNASGPVPPFSPLKLGEKNVKLLRPRSGNYVVTEEEVRHYGGQIFDLISKEVLKLKIFKEYPFTTEAVQQAHKDLTSGKTVGKLIIKVKQD